jgi:16S rRNA (guanine527-N7)-methyltransferase
MAATLEAPVRAVDLGSGAGIPGLALAGIWPESAWVLVDAAQRRVHLLEETVDALGWRDRVIVRHGRAEVLGHEPGLRGSADLVTSRSFGPPAVAAECGAAFLVPGGVLAVTEPPDPGEARWDDDGLAQLGLVRGPSAAGLQLLRSVQPLGPGFPRRPGIPVKRPLF